MRWRGQLNDLQREVLQWVADGCPPGAFDSDSQHLHRISAVALQSRGLIKIKRRRHSWDAELTDRGATYLKEGWQAPPTAAAPAPVAPPVLELLNIMTVDGRTLLRVATSGSRRWHLAPPSAWPSVTRVVARPAVDASALHQRRFRDYDLDVLLEPVWSSRTLCNRRWASMLTAVGSLGDLCPTCHRIGVSLIASEAQVAERLPGTEKVPSSTLG